MPINRDTTLTYVPHELIETHADIITTSDRRNYDIKKDNYDHPVNDPVGALSIYVPGWRNGSLL